MKRIILTPEDRALAMKLIDADRRKPAYAICSLWVERAILGLPNAKTRSRSCLTYTVGLAIEVIYGCRVGEFTAATVLHDLGFDVVYRRGELTSHPFANINERLLWSAMREHQENGGLPGRLAWASDDEPRHAAEVNT